MAIRKRKPGFMGLAEQNAREEGMYQIPKRYQPQGGGAEEYPAFVNQQEMALLKQQGSKGFITPYGIPSFSPASGYGSYGESKDEGMSPGTSQDSGGGAPTYTGDSTKVGGDITGTGIFEADDSGTFSENMSWQGAINSIRAATQHQTADGTWVWNDPTKTEPVESINDASNSGLTPAQWQQQQQAAEPSAEEIAAKVEKKRLKDKRESKIEGVMKDSEGRTADDPDYDESTAKMDTTDSYEGYKQEHKELGKDVKGLTEGTMQDDQGRGPDDPNYDETTGKMRGGFAGDVKKLGAYESKFGDLATAAGKTGKEGQDYYQGAVDPVTGERTGGVAKDYKDAATAGQTEMQRLSRGEMTDDQGRTADDPNYDASTATKQGGFKQITGDAQAAAGGRGEAAGGRGEALSLTAAGKIGTAAQSGVDAAARGETASGTGATDFRTGAKAVGDVQTQFGKEGFQKEAGGYQSQIEEMAKKAQSGDVGQREAAMLKGQMEEGRMASQKGSEEKLRRSMAQSGASPAEIASKVAQFQRQSAGQQAQAGRSEALSSQLQGQQMGQAGLGQAAGLTGQAMGALGQKAGMAGQQASLGAQQAALRGKGAAMQMQGAQMGMSGAQMGMQGAQSAGQMGMAGAGMGMQGAQMGMQGAEAQTRARLASLQGQTATGQAAAGYGMQGVQGAAGLYGQGMNAAFQGQQQQGNMLGQGMGAVQAAGAARGQQMQGVETQGKFIDAQGQYTQAQLNDIIQQQTMAYNKEQADATNAANTAANAGGGGGGGGFDLFNIGTWSDIRLKDNIELLEEGKDGDPNIYSFNYKWDSDTTWSGVMAQELLDTKHADAVRMSPEGFYKVDYTKLGIQFKQLST